MTFKGNSRIGSACAGIAAVFGLSAAQAAVIDFEGFAGGTIIDDDIAGVTIGATANRAWLPQVATIFDTGTHSGGNFDLFGPFSTSNAALEDNYDAGNILVIQGWSACDAQACEHPDDSPDGGQFVIEFDELVNLHSVDFFDIESVEAGAPVEAYKVELFGGNGDTLVGSWTVPDTGGDNTYDRLTMNAEGIRRLEITLAGSGGIDNINYTVIPIPAALWLFGSALAIVASRIRRPIRS